MAQTSQRRPAPRVRSWPPRSSGFRPCGPSEPRPESAGARHAAGGLLAGGVPRQRSRGGRGRDPARAPVAAATRGAVRPAAPPLRVRVSRGPEPGVCLSVPPAGGPSGAGVRATCAGRERRAGWGRRRARSGGAGGGEARRGRRAPGTAAACGSSRGPSRAETPQSGREASGGGAASGTGRGQRPGAAPWAELGAGARAGGRRRRRCCWRPRCCWSPRPRRVGTAAAGPRGRGAPGAGCAGRGGPREAEGGGAPPRAAGLGARCQGVRGGAPEGETRAPDLEVKGVQEGPRVGGALRALGRGRGLRWARLGCESGAGSEVGVAWV